MLPNMQTNSVTHTASNGATIEVGTITHEGRSFSATGAIVDESAGLIFGYVKCLNPDSHPTCQRFELTNWEGATIMPLTRTGKATGFYGTKLECFAGTLNGRRYSGRGLGSGMCIRMRAGRSL